MCRSIKCLAHFEPPASDEEIREAAVQFVRKLSGARRPSRTNEAVFNGAVEDVTEARPRLIRSLATNGAPEEPGGGGTQGAGQGPIALRAPLPGCGTHLNVCLSVSLWELHASGWT